MAKKPQNTNGCQAKMIYNAKRKKHETGVGYYRSSNSDSSCKQFNYPKILIYDFNLQNCCPPWNIFLTKNSDLSQAHF